MLKDNAFGETADYLFYESISWTTIWPGWAREIRVTDFTEIKYLRPDCSDTSFYECLEEDLATASECGVLCEVVSMPNTLLPPCNSLQHLECSREVFDQRVNDNNHKCRSQKSCNDFQYGTTVITYPTYFDENPNRLTFEYTFETPMSSEGLRIQTPYKVVRTEYLIWIDIALIGNVGGTLGMTIG